MTRSQLEHAIRAVCDVAEVGEVIIIGSQSILGAYPNAPISLRQSIEVDVMLRQNHDRLATVEGTLGELSQFHHTHDFYVHGVDETTAFLPLGWQDRLVEVRSSNTRNHTGWCLDVTDLAASKLAAFRDKDREFVRALLSEWMIRPDVLLERIEMLTVESPRRDRIRAWARTTIEDLGID